MQIGNEPLRLTPEVIARINEELAYQETLHEVGRSDTKDHGVEGRLVMLEAYTRKAIDAWANNCGDDQALDVMRKIAAIAVRGLLTYGCPPRKR
jgi:hypothetical protein